MKFLGKDAVSIQVTDSLIVHEYCPHDVDLPIDGAVAAINGVFGPKVNTTFAELIFVLAGNLKAEINGVVHDLKEHDMCIIKPGEQHKLVGESCQVFVSCAPRFKREHVVFINEVSDIINQIKE